LISLIIVNGKIGNFIKAQTRLEKDIENSFTKSFNEFSSDDYYGNLNNYLYNKLENITEELNIISSSIKDVENIFDKYVVNNNLLKNHSANIELDN